jgi:raffinose/stachyose/melibiose transport system permease protein
MKHYRAPWFLPFVAFCLVLVAVFVWTPVVWLFQKSFYDYSLGEVPRWTGLRNFSEVLTADPLIAASLRLLAIVIAFQLATKIVPLVVARLLYGLTGEKSRHAYRTVFLLPWVIPGVAVQLIWSQLIYSHYGMLNRVAAWWGGGHSTVAWLSDPHYALAAVLFVGFPFVSGLELLLFYSGFSRLPDSVREAAALDGCRGWRRFLLVELPLLKPEIATVVSLTLITSIQTYENVLVMTKGGPGFSTALPGFLMYLQAFVYGRFGYACVIGLVLFVVTLVLVYLTRQWEARSHAE